MFDPGGVAITYATYRGQILNVTPCVSGLIV
jgi:hypothetical protein